MKSQKTTESADLQLLVRMLRAQIALCAGLMLLMLLTSTECRAQEEEAGDDGEKEVAAAVDDKAAPEATKAGDDALEALIEAEDGETGTRPVDVTVLPSSLPAHVHCGQLLKIEKQEFGVDAVDLDKVLSQSKFDPSESLSEDVVSQRGCPDGKVLAICHFSIAPGRSISKYDYVLECDGESAACLAMAVEGEPFDARRSKISKTGVARLLYDVPATASTLTLRPVLSTRIPLVALKDLPFGQAAEVVEEDAVEEAPETEDDTKATESEDGQDADGQTQPEAESKP